MRVWSTEFLALILSLHSRPVLGVVRLVPTDFATIQAAINASAGGDTVLVLPGTYTENIIVDRQIAVRSAAGPAVTVIDGGSPRNPDSASVVIITRGSIEGFDLRNGVGTMITPPPYETRWGGGVLTMSDPAPGPLVASNWIHDNRLVAFNESNKGAGIHIAGVARVISNRVFANEVGGRASSEGAGIEVGPYASALSVIEGNEVFDNHATHPAEHGGIICIWASLRHNIIACNSGDGLGSAVIGGTGPQGARIEGNTIVANWSNTLEAAVYIGTNSPGYPVFGNNITHNVGPGLNCFVSPPGSIVAQCNNIYSNGPGGQVEGDCSGIIGQNGNISVDPQYGSGQCPSTHADWCLGADSPLLPANSPPGCGLIGALGECPPIAVPEVVLPRPGVFWVLDPRPNPFAVRTEIPFHLGLPADVEVTIYGVLGRRVRTLRAGLLGAGDHELAWDARDDGGRRAAAGGYVAVIRASSREVTRTLLLVW